MLRRFAVGVALAYVVVGGMFIVGETFTDPGGWDAVGLVAVWLVPLLGLGWLALWRPHVAAASLAAITGAVVVVSIAAAVLGHRWSAFEDHHGPVRAIVVFALCGVLAAFGYRRPTAGGILLLIGSVVPAVLSAVTRGPGTAALPIVALPGVVVGVLYLLSARRARPTSGEHAAPPTGESSGSGRASGAPPVHRRRVTPGATHADGRWQMADGR